MRAAYALVALVGVGILMWVAYEAFVLMLTTFERLGWLA